MKMFQTIYDAAGLLTRRWRERILENGLLGASGYVPANLSSRAKTCRLIVVNEQMTLVFSNERGECYRWEINKAQLRGVVRDGVAELLK